MNVQHAAAAANGGAEALLDVEAERSGDCGVDRVASPLEHIKADVTA